jgi:DNA-binding CsgD family transcriptional regulator
MPWWAGVAWLYARGGMSLQAGPRLPLRGRASECAALDALLEAARAGESGTLVLRGEAGIGKTALLEYAAMQSDGFRVVRAVGVEAEMELPFAAVHQLSIPLLDARERLPPPQRDALETAFGLSSGPRPDRFLVGLALLSLLAAAAEPQPLICLVDDAQWLDRSSGQVISLVARRLRAESVVILFAERDGDDPSELAGLPELRLHGLSEADATELVASVTLGPLDESVRDRIIAEAHGNPLALLELPRGLSSASLAGGFAVASGLPLPSRIEASFRRRVGQLPMDTQRFLLVAAADPVGDPTVLWRAISALGNPAEAVTPAEADDMIEIRARVAFRHPLLRSAIYRAAHPKERRAAHGALAAGTDPETDPDRRAWHRAHATLAPNDDVAVELERSADRAQRRGGVAAAAAFLERATALTADPAHRGARALDAAEARFEAGATGTALELLATAQLSPLDTLQRARLERLRAQIAYMSSRGGDAPQLLLDAARRLEPLDAGLARATYLDAFAASIYAGRLAGDRAIRDVAEAARAAPRRAGRSGAIDLLVDSLAIRFSDGYVAAVPSLERALRALMREGEGHEADLSWLWLVSQVAHEVFDDEAWYSSADRAVQVARDRGALTALPALLDAQGATCLHAGRFRDAVALIGEAEAINEATGGLPFRYVSLAVAAWRGEEAEAAAVIEARLRDATESGEGLAISLAEYTRAVLYNGLGRYEAALAAAQRACEYEDLGLFHWSLTELIEAGVRSGRRDAAEAACRHLEERTAAVNTHWALGMRARSRALLSSGDDADSLYRESIERLAHSRVAVQLARSQLLYGEWLRRENRRVDAREQLRAAHEFFDRMGAHGFAERAGRELLATGETVRRRVDETRGDLTAQEVQIARLAGDGYTNPEIGAQLFLSPRTVEWHLHKVFTKLGISSRKQVREALPATGRR